MNMRLSALGFLSGTGATMSWRGMTSMTRHVVSSRRPRARSAS